MGKPKIRFKGFTEEWEQRKLGDVFQEYSEKNHPELQALTIIQGGGTVLREESDRNLQYDKLNLSGYKMVCENDFIVHLRSFEGGLEKSNHNGLISPAYHTFHGENVDSRFYYSYFRSYEFIKHKLVPHVYGIRDGRSIDIDGMRTIKIPYTSCDEQKKIGDYIESLDTLITLHQRKCDETKKLKKYMLQKMFPQNGMKFPEIRFEGFTSDWEQRKLGEYVEITSGDSPAKFCEGDINYVKVDDLNYAYKTVLQTQHKVSQNNSVKMVLAGSVIFPKRGAAILTNKVRVLGVDSYMDTNMMALSSEMLDTDFLYILLSKEGLYKIADTSTIPQINNKHIEPYEICLPKLDEQKMIGQYFSNLDHLITLHQRKCDELMKIKKYMLQNMFV